MFIIIGGDGKEYGPATTEQIRAWITGGRANLDTRAKALGSDEWRRLGDFPEFSGPGETPPVMSALPANAAAENLELADPLTRLGAWLIDFVLGCLAILPGGIFLGASVLRQLLAGNYDLSTIRPENLIVGRILLWVFGLSLLVVQIWLLSTRGQTLGKRLLKIRIVRFVDNANPGFFRVFVLRLFFPTVLSLLLDLLLLLGIIFSIVDVCFIFRADRRCVHDLIAGTKVVRA